ncbi:MAG TPA: hypothetical protein PLX84_09165 [Acidiphilium sp.]|nr:hypothetical protein [Acidiphilium sp.]
MTAAIDPRAARNDAERDMLEMLRKLPEAARRAFRDTLVAMRDGTDLRPHVVAAFRAMGSDDPDDAAESLLAEWDARGQAGVME